MTAFQHRQLAVAAPAFEASDAWLENEWANFCVRVQVAELVQRSQILKQTYQQQFARLMQDLRQRPQAMPLVIGLCGGIGSGKSTVARLLQEQGAIVIGFDSIGHEVRDHEARAALIGHFGPEVLDATGAFDRGQLAQKALDPQHPEQRLWLNALMEPFMLKHFVEQFKRATESPAALVIIEAARLPDFGIEPYLSGVLQVYADVEVAAKRIVSDPQRRDTPESARQKIESQKAMVAGLEAISGLRLRNDGTPEDLQKAVEQYAQEWQAAHAVLSATTSEKSSVITLAPEWAAKTGLHAFGLSDALSRGDQRRLLEALLCNHSMLPGPDEIKSVRVSGEFFNRHRRVCEWIEEHGGRLEWHKPPMSVTEVSEAIRPLGPELPGAPVIITGTFDLLNNETLDFIRRAYRLFGNRRPMILAPSDDSRRRTTFPLEQRVDIASLALRAEFPNLQIHGYNGMTSTFAESAGATLILRRLRRFTDITSEYTDARALWEHSGGKLDTAYLVPDMHLSHMTSELVRQYARVETDFAHSIRKWCPPFIADLWEEQSSGVNIDFQRIWKLYRRHESQAPAAAVPQAADQAFSGIYAGSFSPPTYGHFEMVERASRFLSTVVMLASVNPKKKNLFSGEESVVLIREFYKGQSGIEADHFDGVTVEYARARAAQVLVRGIRGVADFEAEISLAFINRAIVPDIETLFQFPYRYLDTSSSLVRELASHASLRGFLPDRVPGHVMDALLKK